MAREWYDSNMGRSYPFKKGQFRITPTEPPSLALLPYGAIVDCGFMTYPAANFDPRIHSVYLSRIDKMDDTISIYFDSNAPNLAGNPIIFTRSLSDPTWTLEYANSQLNHVPPEVEESCDGPLWSGYLVTGNMDAIAEFFVGVALGFAVFIDVPPETPILNEGEYVTYAVSSSLESLVAVGPNIHVLPSLIQVISNVTAIHLANDERTRYENPSDCDPVSWPFTLADIYVNKRCVTEHVHFVAGYNVALRSQSSKNSLIVDAAVGAGKGEPCEEIRLCSSESVSSGALHGAESCNGVIRSINGEGGPMFYIHTGKGVELGIATAENKVTLDVSMNDTANCVGGE